MSDQESLTLRVLEAYSRDLGTGVCRIDYETMDSLGASTSDYVEVAGKRKTAAKCLPLYPVDEGKAVVRTDGIVRSNAGVNIGETVTVRKIEVMSAEKITVVPLETLPNIDSSYFSEVMEGLPISRGDLLMVPYFGGRLSFKTRNILPNVQTVRVANTTTFVIKEKETQNVEEFENEEDVEKLSMKVDFTSTEYNPVDNSVELKGHIDVAGISTTGESNFVITLSLKNLDQVEVVNSQLRNVADKEFQEIRSNLKTVLGLTSGNYVQMDLSQAAKRVAEKMIKSFS